MPATKRQLNKGARLHEDFVRVLEYVRTHDGRAFADDYRCRLFYDAARKTRLEFERLATARDERDGRNAVGWARRHLKQMVDHVWWEAPHGQ